MWKQAVCVIFAALICYWMLNLALRWGVFRHVYNHAPGDCHVLPGIENGSEDIEVLPNGLAFISSGFNIMNLRKGPIPGRIYLFDFNSPNLAPINLSILGGEKYTTLTPHGISLWTDPKSGVVYLYVINHTPDGEAVDKFKFIPEQNALQHVLRIDQQLNFHLMNDLAVVAEDQFYYTNYLYRYPLLEHALNLHWGSIGFYNGKKATIALDGLLNPNGIALSKDRKILYLAHIGYEEVRAYSRHDDNTLTFLQSAFVATVPDNLDVDKETGDVWVGAHPVRYVLHRHMENEHVQTHSPSQVLRIRFPHSSSSSSASPEVVEVYSNDGHQLAASTVAARYKKGLLIGTVYTRALYCSLNYY